MDIETWSVMKWVLLVLLAGFIGQFGKMMAQYTVRKAGKGKTQPAAAAGPSPDVSRKDRMAAVSDPAGETSEDPSILPASAGMDKKMLKTLAKQEKKKIKAMSKSGRQ